MLCLRPFSFPRWLWFAAESFLEAVGRVRGLMGKVNGHSQLVGSLRAGIGAGMGMEGLLFELQQVGGRGSGWAGLELRWLLWEAAGVKEAIGTAAHSSQEAGHHMLRSDTSAHSSQDASHAQIQHSSVTADHSNYIIHAFVYPHPPCRLDIE